MSAESEMRKERKRRQLFRNFGVVDRKNIYVEEKWEMKVDFEV